MSFSQPFPLAANMRGLAEDPTYGPDLAVRLICPDCRDPHPNIIEEYSSGDLVCGDCGFVLGDRIVDTGKEWRTFADEGGDDHSRVGAVSDALEGMEQLETTISLGDGSGVARELQRAAARSLRFRFDRNVLDAFRDIASWCEQFLLPKIVSDIARQLFKRLTEEKLLRGKPLEAIMAACIFIACRQARVPRTFKEICTLTTVPKKTLGQCYRVLEQAFGLSPGATAREQGSDANNRSAGSEMLLVRYCNYLDLPVRAQSMCSDIVIAAREHGIGEGRSPVSISGGAIYFTCMLLGKDRSAQQISRVAGVGEKALKTVYKEYCRHREKLVKKEWLEDGRADMDRLELPAEKGHM